MLRIAALSVLIAGALAERWFLTSSAMFACVHRGELVLVAEQDYFGIGADRFHKFCHQGKRDHGGFIDDDQTGAQGIFFIVPELRRAG